MERSVYIISGPAGVGKSTTAGELVQQFDKSALISGDDISHIPVNGRGKPWLCQETLQLTWSNILSLTRNLLGFGYDVVIDYVTLPAQAAWLAENLRDRNVKVFYVVLMVGEAEIVRRDQGRHPDARMGARSVELLREFKEVLQGDEHILNTESYGVGQLPEVIGEILSSPRFLFSRSGWMEGENQQH